MSCNRHSKNEKEHQVENHVTDEFYSRTGGWDYTRMPLIKPYELINLSDEWLLGTFEEGSTKPTRIYGIQQISINQDYSLFLCEQSDFSETTLQKKWCVLEMSTAKEVCFSSEKEFNDYVESKKIPQPTWINAEIAFKQFLESGYLPWMPVRNE